MQYAAKPTFLGIGAQKCATTWLYETLADHPEARLGANREIHFFSYYFDFGFQWYERQFQSSAGPGAVGEVSTSYFHDPSAPRRVYEYDRNMRLILFLRNPIDRALSNHRHEVRIGHLVGGNLSFEFGLINNPSYIEQGLYATHLERWLDYFALDRILVVLVDDIISRPEEIARLLYVHLRIDDTHVPKSLHARANESYVSRLGWLEDTKNDVRRLVRAARMDRVWDALGNVGARSLYRRVNRAPSESVIPPIQSSTREMLQQNFEGEIRRLERILGRSLESWL